MPSSLWVDLTTDSRPTPPLQLSFSKKRIPGNFLPLSGASMSDPILLFLLSFALPNSCARIRFSTLTTRSPYFPATLPPPSCNVCLHYPVPNTIVVRILRQYRNTGSHGDSTWFAWSLQILQFCGRFFGVTVERSTMYYLALIAYVAIPLLHVSVCTYAINALLNFVDVIPCPLSWCVALAWRVPRLLTRFI